MPKQSWDYSRCFLMEGTAKGRDQEAFRSSAEGFSSQLASPRGTYLPFSSLPFFFPFSSPKVLT